MLAELLTTLKDWIIQYHEHDSLLENKLEEELTEEERKAAWEEYEQEKKGLRIPPRQFCAFVIGGLKLFCLHIALPSVFLVPKIDVTVEMFCLLISVLCLFQLLCLQ